MAGLISTWLGRVTIAALLLAVIPGGSGRSPAAAASGPSGLVYAWGYNFYGQLGNATTANSLTPVTANLPAGVTATAIQAGNQHTLALGSDSKVYAWGDNHEGQLGNGTTTNSSTPVVVTLPSGVTATAIAAGHDHSLAAGSDGTLYAWGYNLDGQLGNGTTTSSSTAVTVHLPAGVIAMAIAGGGFHSLGLGSNGKLYAWGYNGYGELGNGTTTSSSSPVVVSLPPGVTATAIGAGTFCSLAIGSDGKVYAWGYNLDGELGNGTTTNSSTPVAVSLPPGVTATAIAAGDLHNMAIGSDGTLYAWGYNGFGQLGNGTMTESHTPAAVDLPAGVTAAGVSAGGSHSLAIGSNGALYAWGSNGEGQLGNGTTTNSTVPEVVNLPLGSIATVAAGGSHSVAVLTPQPGAYAWGSNAAGQLGNGTTTDSGIPIPVQLPAGVTATAVAAGAVHALAAGTDGNVYAWGNNTQGELGNGTTASSAVPAVASLPSGVTATAVAAGGFHSLALGANGKVYAWGYNYDGQLGNGTTTNSSTPVVVSLPAGVTATAIAAGYEHSLAAGSDGRLYAWGYNFYGQLGNGTTTGSHTPVVVDLPAGVRATAVAAGTNHSLAIGSNGMLYAWGSSGHGQLGDGTYIDSHLPVAVKLPSGVQPVAIAAGEFHSLAASADGRLYLWGSNSSGQLGNDTTTDSDVPEALPIVSGLVPRVLAMGAGSNESLVVVERPGATAVVVRRFVAQRSGMTVLLRWQITDPTRAAGFRLIADSRLITRSLVPVHPGIRTYHYRTATPARRYVLQVLLRDGSVVTAATKG